MRKFAALPSDNRYLPVDLCTDDGDTRIASIYGNSEGGQFDPRAEGPSKAVGALFAEVLNRLPEIAALPGFAGLVERASLGIEEIVADDPTPSPKA